MDDVTALRDALVLQYNATAEPSEYGAQEFNADLDALIAKVEAETRAGLVEALKPLALKYASHSGSCCDFDAEGRIVVTRESCKCAPEERSAQEALGMFGRPEDYRAALPAPEPSSGAAPKRVPLPEGHRWCEACSGLGLFQVVEPPPMDAPEPSSGAAPVEERCGCGEAWMSAVHDPLYDPEVEGFHAPYPAPRSVGAGDGSTDR